MKLSFAWKIGIIVMLLSVGISSTCVLSFYVISYKTMMRQIGKNLLHVGRLGVMMIDDEAREAIRRLTAATDKDSVVTPEQIAAMKVGDTLSSLSQADIDRYHASTDFQHLLNILSAITLATIQDMEPKKRIYRVEEPMRMIQEGGFGAYLAVAIKESPEKQVLRYIASAAPVPTADGWPGNPIGNLEKSWESLAYLFEGKSYTDDRLFKDDFYTALSTAVPILDKDGSTLAILCLDYAAPEERNKLFLLSYICIGMILASLLASVVGSYYLTRKLNGSLQILYNAAQKVAANDLTVSVDIQSKDEFALLGQVFNQMVVSIKAHISALEGKNAQMASIVLDMHDGVGAILTSIAMTSQKPIVHQENSYPEKVDKIEAINHLAREGLSEVRFLMNALDYDQFDYSVILEEIRLQCTDILAPSGIRFGLLVVGDLPKTRIEFSEFLELQRMFRETFVNIVKHSKATTCSVTVDLTGAEVAIRISDNGKGGDCSLNNCGRGLKSLAVRARRVGGRMEYQQQDGFHIHLFIPHPTSQEKGNVLETIADHKNAL